jgi:hypothetical protein
MAIEERSSSLARVIRARREAIAQGPTPTDITISARANKFLCKNTGANPVRINFDTDATPQYWELAVGESLPAAIDISDKVVLHARGIGGASELQFILWS